ncbi:IS200/IS605 family element transposase accessory protein TnpB [Clostridium argentinense]|nr:IS200/IS605 family element transposase accessory protein TnpB [Clostridium argentinense]NFP51685.1 IS200/IS605 family element transposase accessory protein TnpB [Clostridium argentinense]NFP74016.1 IS200/IS605 family element transposase accessory protein TnpB [Clostridium argentinense]NFP77066.1 IS200/IS605 family element transposase accessory protein TnpB [Clostridium argentinense]
MSIIGITITSKVQIYPTDEQIEKLTKTMIKVRKALNYISNYVYDNNCLNQSKINKDTYYYLREKYSLKSQMAQSVMKTVIAKYKTNKSNGHDFTLVQFKKLEYDLVWNRDYSLTNGVFSLNTLDGRLKIRFETKGMEKYFDGTYKFGTAKLVYKYNKYFLHIPMTKEYPQTTPFAINKIVGIDLGINFLATVYDSYGKTIFFNGKQVKAKRGHYKILRKQLQECGTKSAKRRIKSIGSRENRYISNINHNITKALVDHYGANTLFVLEDLTNVRTSTEKVNINNRYVSVSWAFYQFRELLTYKAQMNQSLVIAVNPKFTSQMCPKCGHIEKSNRDKKRHIFCCKNCNYQSNDDRIGAMNLWRKGIEYIEANSKEIVE